MPRFAPVIKIVSISSSVILGHPFSRSTQRKTSAW
jgi:hypothetical protein